MFSVILHTLDNGAVLSITESKHYRAQDARKHASKCATEYAARYEGATVEKRVGDRWTIHKANGITFAQFDVE